MRKNEENGKNGKNEEVHKRIPDDAKKKIS